MLAINPKIKQKSEDIRNKIFGAEVRESLASGIEAISEDVEATIDRQDAVEQQFQDVLDETTGKDVISAPELIAARNGKSNLKTRLDDEHAEVTAQLQQTEQNLNAQLAHKANENEVVKKGYGKLDDFDEETRGLIQGIEEGTINAVLGNENVRNENIANKAIDLDKVDFSEKSTNLYNHEDILIGYAVDATQNGVVVEGSASQYTSGFIRVDENSDYFIRYHNRICYYNAKREFISGTHAGGGHDIVRTTPPETAFIRITWNNANIIKLQQINKGSEDLPFEFYYHHIPKEHIQENRNIDLTNTTFYRAGGKNLLDPNKLIYDGYNLVSTTGELRQHSIYITSDFIEIPNIPLTARELALVCWYTQDMEFIKTDASPFNLSPPTDAVYLRFSVEKVRLDTAQIEEGYARTSYEPFKAVVDEQFLDLPEQTNTPTIPSTGTGVPSGTELSLAEENARKHVPNVDEPLNIPSYDGSGDVTHPSVLYFENGWNGYKFWMAMTPYHNSQGIYENPSILASNDNITWDEPPVNPVAPLEEGERYNSDPDIVMVGDTMELWYRSTVTASDGVTLETTMWRRTSTDGANWSEREYMFDDVTFENFRSPTMEYEDGKYKCWYTTGKKSEGFVIKYGESSDGKNWETRVLNVPQPKGGFTFWHGDAIQHEDGRVEMIIMCQKDGSYTWSVFYTMSLDNQNFIEPVLIIEPTHPSGRSVRWDYNHLYRPSMVMVGNEYYVYYSTPARIGLTTGKSLLSLGLGKNRFSKYPKLNDVNIKFGPQNAFSANDFLTAYPIETIVHFDVWSPTADNWEWPTLSGHVEVNRIFAGTNKGVQYFHPAGNHNYYLKRNATDTGWSAWIKFEGLPA